MHFNQLVEGHAAPASCPWLQDFSLRGPLRAQGGLRPGRRRQGRGRRRVDHVGRHRHLHAGPLPQAVGRAPARTSTTVAGRPLEERLDLGPHVVVAARGRSSSTSTSNVLRLASAPSTPSANERAAQQARVERPGAARRRARRRPAPRRRRPPRGRGTRPSGWACGTTTTEASTTSPSRPGAGARAWSRAVSGQRCRSRPGRGARSSVASCLAPAAGRPIRDQQHVDPLQLGQHAWSSRSPRSRASSPRGRGGGHRQAGHARARAARRTTVSASSSLGHRDEVRAERHRQRRAPGRAGASASSSRRPSGHTTSSSAPRRRAARHAARTRRCAPERGTGDHHHPVRDGGGAAGGGWSARWFWSSTAPATSRRATSRSVPRLGVVKKLSSAARPARRGRPSRRAGAPGAPPGSGRPASTSSASSSTWSGIVSRTRTPVSS